MHCKHARVASWQLWQAVGWYAAMQVALNLFETSWDELIGQPSSVSAGPEVAPSTCLFVAALWTLSRGCALAWMCVQVRNLTAASSPFAQEQADRGAILEAAQRKGFVDNVTGWRRSLKGSRFKLIDAILFNVISPGSEDVLGQV